MIAAIPALPSRRQLSARALRRLFVLANLAFWLALYLAIWRPL